MSNWRQSLGFRSSSFVERSQGLSAFDPRACREVVKVCRFSILELCREVAGYCPASAHFLVSSSRGRQMSNVNLQSSAGQSCGLPACDASRKTDSSKILNSSQARSIFDPRALSRGRRLLPRVSPFFQSAARGGRLCSNANSSPPQGGAADCRLAMQAENNSTVTFTTSRQARGSENKTLRPLDGARGSENKTLRPLDKARGSKTE